VLQGGQKDKRVSWVNLQPGTKNALAGKFEHESRVEAGKIESWRELARGAGSRLRVDAKKGLDPEIQPLSYLQRSS
jgi:hypothetical protein